MGRPSTGWRHAAVSWRRVVSLLASSALVVATAAPLAPAVGRVGVGRCRDRCCCVYAKPADAPCLRLACGCSRPFSGAGLTDAPAREALVVAATMLPHPAVRGLPRVAAAFRVSHRFAAPPDPPPWRAVDSDIR